MVHSWFTGLGGGGGELTILDVWELPNSEGYSLCVCQLPDREGKDRGKFSQVLYLT